MYKDKANKQAIVLFHSLNTNWNTNLCYILFTSESIQLVITLKEWKDLDRIDSCLGNGWNKHGENETLKELVNY